jgi:aspartate-semialdehyde dehydrogenase
MTGRRRVGIVGATGTVGQRFVHMLERHPQFEVTALAASDRSAGKPYEQACVWRLPGGMPAAVRRLEVRPPEPPLDCDLVFSSLPGELAREVEGAFAAAGYPVLSNSSAFRMDPDVPLLIPEVNPEHLGLLQGRRGKGFVVANPNCSVAVLALALAPLHQRFTVESVAATTMQAISGAGYPGVAALDITDNVVPYIGGEEEKVERESQKILGRLVDGRVLAAPFVTSAQCHRVNVVDGHLVAVRVKLAQPADPGEVAATLAGFAGRPQRLGLPTAPPCPIIVRSEPDRPQPRLDRDAGGGMSITVGRIARDPLLSHRFVALGHNTVRGAAGAAILNAELLLAEGWIVKRET